MPQEVFSLCFMCTVRCPIRVEVENDEVTWIEGNPYVPGIEGALCAKGSAGLALLNDNERPQHPMIRTGPRGDGLRRTPMSPPRTTSTSTNWCRKTSSGSTPGPQLPWALKTASSWWRWPHLWAPRPGSRPRSPISSTRRPCLCCTASARRCPPRPAVIIRAPATPYCRKIFPIRQAAAPLWMKPW